jgi:Fur family ferric uptake transcriptional regulator
MSESVQNNVRERFNSFLQSRGLKLTSERLTILNEALATEGHFEADDLLVILKQKGRKTSRATVYRTLEILAEAAVPRKIYFGSSATHFEKVSNKTRQDYMICQKCGARYEFHIPELQIMQNSLAEKHNFKIKDYCYQIFGLCKKCSEDDV